VTTDRPYEVVLVGATGFAGGLTARYLAQRAPADLRWAIAGRDVDRLRSLAAELTNASPAGNRVGVVPADATDEVSLRRLAESTRLVATTVGPFLAYGSGLVHACARNGTDYVDISGEPEFVDRMWLEAHPAASRSGARLVHCCGFDSIPTDLGVWWTLQFLPYGAPLHVAGYVRAKGGLSAGTLRSAVNSVGRAPQLATAARQRRRSEPRQPGRRVGSLPARPHPEPSSDRWAVPLPSIDAAVVRRSARALDRYGPDFRYGHFAVAGSPATAAGLLVGGTAAAVLTQLPPARAGLRWLAGRIRDPDAERRARSWFRIRFFAGAGGSQAPYDVVTEVSGGDPGYDETAKMLAESALCLVRDDLPALAGQLTPAQAMGDALVSRLVSAGISFHQVPHGEVTE